MNQLEIEKVYYLNQECSIADHHRCQLATVVCMAADISEQEGLALPPQLQRIMDTQIFTESDVRSALLEWVDTIPEWQREEAEELLSIVEKR
ncbi:hypothetical protein LJK88_25490 [Paenibacillus sp. P26]|nr:hypothetical protein LJK88_25490 [Paenibacillus sp. P26]UUZ95229.1 hypothetical protein LJK87_12485 [Paenibacillus sp. P25]